ncbi:UNKNOWN [Stylonychia lemnae]|uniref:Uncharacterized protein n=1 Tax=Stylonychia lemnae TaxID=5949 RepID=A0A078BB99_STYLE|nr:UNKNOWN [Stylonychia lemnae]|eukprot:CDW91835.1 UNKNOWN [Stylonychia lemnae]
MLLLELGFNESFPRTISGTFFDPGASIIAYFCGSSIFIQIGIPSARYFSNFSQISRPFSSKAEQCTNTVSTNPLISPVVPEDTNGSFQFQTYELVFQQNILNPPKHKYRIYLLDIQLFFSQKPIQQNEEIQTPLTQQSTYSQIALDTSQGVLILVKYYQRSRSFEKMQQYFGYPSQSCSITTDSKNGTLLLRVDISHQHCYSQVSLQNQANLSIIFSSYLTCILITIWFSNNKAVKT